MCEFCNGVNHNPDCEDNPRTAAAIRTALMLGAVFEQSNRGWSAEGLGHHNHASSRSMAAWLFIGRRGFGISQDPEPRAFAFKTVNDVISGGRNVPRAKRR